MNATFLSRHRSDVGMSRKRHSRRAVSVIHEPDPETPMFRMDEAIERVLVTLGPLEIRELAPALVVSTVVKGTADHACTEALRRCAAGLGRGWRGWWDLLRRGPSLEPMRITVAPLLAGLWRVRLHFPDNGTIAVGRCPAALPPRLRTCRLTTRRVAASAFTAAPTPETIAAAATSMGAALAGLDWQVQGGPEIHFLSGLLGLGRRRPCEIELPLG
jgi:hypothetical protein